MSAAGDRDLAEVLVLGDQHAPFLRGEIGDGLVVCARVVVEDMPNVVAGSPQRLRQAGRTALVEQQPQGSASTTASSAR